MRKEGLLLTAIAILIVTVFAWPHPNPYRCYIVHQRKDGSCPRGYVRQDQIVIEGQTLAPYFTEADGTGEYACLDLRRPSEIDPRNPDGVG